MRPDIVVSIVIIAALIQTIGILGLLAYYMKKIHTSIIDQFAVLQSLSLINKNDSKGCGCHGESNK